jgi:hypothetical protein
MQFHFVASRVQQAFFSTPFFAPAAARDAITLPLATAPRLAMSNRNDRNF